MLALEKPYAKGLHFSTIYVYKNEAEVLLCWLYNTWTIIIIIKNSYNLASWSVKESAVKRTKFSLSECLNRRQRILRCFGTTDDCSVILLFPRLLHHWAIQRSTLNHDQCQNSLSDRRFFWWFNPSPLSWFFTSCLKRSQGLDLNNWLRTHWSLECRVAS